MNPIRSLLFFFVIVLSAPASGQVGTGLENSLGLNLGNLRFGSGVSQINDKKIGKGVIGSSLLFEKYVLGRIGFIHNRVSEPVMLNYDLMSGVTIVEGFEDKYSILPEHVDSLFVVDINGDVIKSFVSTLYDDEHIVLEVLLDGDVALLKRHSIKLLNPTYNQALDTGEKRYTIKHLENYFLRYQGDLHILPKSYKKFLRQESMPKNIKRVIPKKKYSLKNEKKLIELFQLVNHKLN